MYGHNQKQFAMNKLKSLVLMILINKIATKSEVYQIKDFVIYVYLNYIMASGSIEFNYMFMFSIPT